MVDELAEKLSALSAHAKREQDERRAAFQRLRTESPESAEFVTAVAAEFGKPAAIAIRFADGTTYRRGEFTPAQELPDFESRLQRWLEIAARMARKGPSEAQG